MRDRFGRPLTGLRISVTERCNLNCFYCHREGCPSGSREMGAGEIGEIVGLAKGFGMRKIKLTGGEPLLREDIVEIVTAVTAQGMREVSMTTNGTLLAGVAGELAEAGLDRINVSLDTLDGATYKRITGKGLLREVLEGIDAAIDAGLTPVKINMVLLKGVNEGEVEQMVAFACGRGAILQLIELLPLEEGLEVYRCGLDEIEDDLRARAVAVRTRRSMHARKRYVLLEGEVEIVHPMHNSEFCAHCSRLRLTPDGYLKPCLMRNDNLVNVLSPLRAGNLDGAREAFRETIARREPYFKN